MSTSPLNVTLIVVVRGTLVVLWAGVVLTTVTCEEAMEAARRNITIVKMRIEVSLILVLIRMDDRVRLLQICSQSRITDL